MSRVGEDKGAGSSCTKTSRVSRVMKSVDVAIAFCKDVAGVGLELGEVLS